MAFAATFLAVPDLFPERLSGEPWGDTSMVVELAGDHYRFSGLSAHQQQQIAENYAPWCRPPTAQADVLVRCFRAAWSDFLPLEQIVFEPLIEVDYQPLSVRLVGYPWMARIGWSAGWSGALWTPCEEGAAFRDLIENYFRILVAYRLLHQGGLLVHSAAVVEQGEAYLFPGASGNGKSTLSRLSLAQGLTVLSDDSNALLPLSATATPETDGFAVSALPFGGDLRQRRPPGARFPLQRIAALTKGHNPSCTPLSRSQAVALLVGCAPFVNGDPHRLGQVFAVAEALVAQTATCRLTFSLDQDFWPVLTQNRIPPAIAEADTSAPVAALADVFAASAPTLDGGLR